MLSMLVSASRRLENKLSLVFKAFIAFSGIAIVGMMVVVTIDATVRKILGVSFYGSYDTVTYLLSILVFLSLVVCQTKNAHFSIDLVTSRFPLKVRMWTYCIGLFISVGVCWVLAWKLVEYGIRLIETHSTSMEFSFLPTFPFPWIGALCFTFLGLMFLIQTIDHLAKAMGKEDEAQG
jgi:TRAP-type C4-dicarboxylate transport system permease small subunit